MYQYVLLTTEQLKRSLGREREVWRVLVWSIVWLSFATVLLDNSPTILTLERLLPLTASYLLYTFNGVFVFPRLTLRSEKPIAIAVYFATQFCWAGFIMSQTDGVASVVLIALVGQVVSTYTGWRVVLGDLALFALAVVPQLLLRNADQFVAGDVLTSVALVSVVMFLVHVGAWALRDRIELQRVSDELNEANTRLREFAVGREEDAAAKERTRLAREIHDTLGHYLTVVNLQLTTAREQVGDENSIAAATLDRTQLLVQEGLRDVRRSVRAMRQSPIENKSLPEALEALVEESRVSGMQSDLLIRGVPFLMNAQIKLAFYRAAQEGVTNVRKHARASRIDMLLDYRSMDAVRLVITDDGVGARYDEVGFGLLGIRERVNLIGGQMRIRTAEGQGFSLEIELPNHSIHHAVAPDDAELHDSFLRQDSSHTITIDPHTMSRPINNQHLVSENAS